MQGGPARKTLLCRGRRLQTEGRVRTSTPSRAAEVPLSPAGTHVLLISDGCADHPEFYSGLRKLSTTAATGSLTCERRDSAIWRPGEATVGTPLETV